MEVDKTDNLGASEEAIAARRHPGSAPKTQRTRSRGTTTDGCPVPSMATFTMNYSWVCSATQCMARLLNRAGPFSQHDCLCRRTKDMQTSLTS